MMFLEAVVEGSQQIIEGSQEAIESGEKAVDWIKNLSLADFQSMAAWLIAYLSANAFVILFFGIKLILQRASANRLQEKLNQMGIAMSDSQKEAYKQMQDEIVKSLDNMSEQLVKRVIEDNNIQKEDILNTANDMQAASEEVKKNLSDIAFEEDQKEGE
jgi:hypothetical protein